jgi:predicted metal-dependent HD superfamily phosphohydrolase
LCHREKKREGELSRLIQGRENKDVKEIQTLMHHLQHEWEKLLQAFGIEQTKAETIFTELASMYSSPGRVYHTLEHIQAMLVWIERLRDNATDLPSLQLACWFHDSIYDPSAGDNEEQSVTYAQRVLSDFALSSKTIDAVSHMILSTKTHWTEDSNTDCHILLDADLAILGAPVLYYDSYVQAIRQEYKWVPEASYKTGRMQVLQAFLSRERIYWTESVHVVLEGQARENLQREIALLS